MESRVIIIIGAVIVLAIGGGIWWWASNHPVEAPKAVTAPPAKEPTAVDETDVPVTPGVQRPVLPALDASDDFVRGQAGSLSAQLSESEWLTQEDLVRRFAVVIDNATNGDYPRRQLGFLAPPEKYAIVQKDDRIFVDPEGYHRFDHFVDIVVSVDAQRAAILLDNIAPLLVPAMKELGRPDPEPIVAMHKAIDQVLTTPVVDGDIELVQPEVVYLYADPKLESLKPLQKQLLRMGPQNLQRLKTYLTQVNGHL